MTDSPTLTGGRGARIIASVAPIARVLCLLAPVLLVAAEPDAAADASTLGFGRSVVTVIALGIALILLAVLFLLRRFLGVVINVIFVLIGAFLVVIALFGHDIGVYAAIDAIVRSGAEP